MSSRRSSSGLIIAGVPVSVRKQLNMWLEGYFFEVVYALLKTANLRDAQNYDWKNFQQFTEKLV